MPQPDKSMMASMFQQPAMRPIPFPAFMEPEKVSEASLLRELIDEIKGLRSDIAAKKWLSDDDMRWFEGHHNGGR